MSPQELVNNITQLNKRINENNEKAKRSKWSADEIRKQLEDKINEYNSKNNTNITLDDPNTIVVEAKKVLKQKMEEHARLSKGLEFVESKDFDKAGQLLGIQIEGTSKIKIDEGIEDLEELEESVNVALENFQYKEKPKKEEEVDPFANAITMDSSDEVGTQSQSEPKTVESNDLDDITITSLSLDDDEEEVEVETTSETYSNVINKITDGEGLNIEDKNNFENQSTDDSLSGINLDISDSGTLSGASDEAKDLLNGIGNTSDEISLGELKL